MGQWEVGSSILFHYPIGYLEVIMYWIRQSSGVVQVRHDMPHGVVRWQWVRAVDVEWTHELSGRSALSPWLKLSWVRAAPIYLILLGVKL